MTQVKLTKETFNTLKNFATINKSVVIDTGSKIRTISINKNIYASAEVSEEFPSQVPIYDLGVFLSGLSLFEQPIFDFSNDSKLVVRDETKSHFTNFTYSDPSLIVQPPDKEITLPSVDVEFILKPAVLDKLLRASSVYQVPDLCLYTKEGDMLLKVCDKKNDTANSFEVPVGKSDDTFCYCFKVENLRLQPEEYNVQISGARIARFVSTNERHLEYFIALEPDSK
tara:strand:- start:9872 stop:10549 length:678 start_codon:yes stop_codon:yes gene_type:complete